MQEMFNLIYRFDPEQRATDAMPQTSQEACAF